MRYYVERKAKMQDLFDDLGGNYTFFYEIEDDSDCFEKYYHRELIKKRLTYLGTCVEKCEDGLEKTIMDVLDASICMIIEFIQEKIFHYGLTIAYNDDSLYGVFDCDHYVAVCKFDTVEELLCFICQPYQKHSRLNIVEGANENYNYQYEALVVEGNKVRIQKERDILYEKKELIEIWELPVDKFYDWLMNKTKECIEWEEY